MKIETLASLALAAGHELPPVPAELRSESLENPRVPFSSVFDIPESPSGVTITELNSLQITAVWRCVNLISGALARSPLVTYRTIPAGKERARDHYTWKLFQQAANPFCNYYRFRRMMQTWLSLWGNAFAEIEISGRGQVTALWPWRPDRVYVDDILGPEKLLYTYTRFDGSTRTVPAAYVLHLRGLETDGYMGMSPIRAAAVSLGLAKAAEAYGARFFRNNGRPGGVIEHPNALSKAAAQRIVDDWERIHAGIHGAHRIGILEEGMKYHDVGIPPEDMQFLQTRQFSVIDIARLFGVPPHKIAELSRATFSNIEHQGIDFVQDSIGDHATNWEAELEHQLLSETEQKTISFRFYLDALMRGDRKTRYDAHAIGRDRGWLSANDIRDFEDLNRIEGGDEYLIALNMAPLTSDAAESPDPDDPADPQATEENDPGEPPKPIQAAPVPGTSPAKSKPRPKENAPAAEKPAEKKGAPRNGRRKT